MSPIVREAVCSRERRIEDKRSGVMGEQRIRNAELWGSVGDRNSAVRLDE